ncbi:DUF4192 domain-containing protein [Rhodococcus tibetensis]|uniref:DUF4192 domain-containing protein n=1 Tax=Rhodococcus tibetensis TaxID=2965064 RepID=A0ABT1QMD1_9NOCA|nr:DUF4192 domain-containing protein [Rhodococcus sp. FXJ9.536]MCQ4122247.1 DUF4192 domain-containing protein [Rhodococcus sp. FXJ9.536]
MTTSAFPHRSGSERAGRHHSPPEQLGVRLSDPGDLLAAIPAFLGFRPERSIVALCLTENSTVGAVMRHDLVLGGGDTPTAPMYAAVDQFAVVCEREQATGVLVVLIDDRFADPSATSRSELATIVAEFEDLLDRTSTELLDVFVTADIGEGCRWFGLLSGGRYGVQSDPVASHVAVAQVVSGRAIRASREDLEATVEAGPVGERIRIAELIDDIRESAPRIQFAGRSDIRGDRRELELVLDHIARLPSGEAVAAHECADLAVALDNLVVRDSLLALAVGEYAGDAEQLWILLARHLPDPERATAAALLGYSAYVRGDGPLAGVAFCAALESDPDHALAALLDKALQSGLRPGAVRELAGLGYDSARKIGVILPPPIDT